MDKELREYYEERFLMFSSKGWQDLVEDVEKMIDSTKDINLIETEQDLKFKKGELSILRWLVNLEQISRDAYEGLNESAV